MYLVSACLAGINCRYDANNTEHSEILELVKQGRAIPICPEILGGLAAPRPSCEITTDEAANKIVMGNDGHNYTKEFNLGAEKTLAIAKILDVKKVFLKSKSPSCGCGIIYDGTFSGKFIDGNGMTAELLLKNGIEIISI